MPNNQEIKRQRALDLAQQQDRLASMQQEQGEQVSQQAMQEQQMAQEAAMQEQMEQEQQDEEQQSLFNKNPKKLTSSEKKYILELAKKKEGEAKEAFENANSPDPPLAVRILKSFADGVDTVASLIAKIFGLIPLIGIFLELIIKLAFKIPTTIIRAIAKMMDMTYRKSQKTKGEKAQSEVKQLRKMIEDKKEPSAEKEGKNKEKNIRLWPGGPVLPKWNLQIVKYAAIAIGIGGGVVGVGSGVGVFGIMCQIGASYCITAIWETIKTFFSVVF